MNTEADFRTIEAERVRRSRRLSILTIASFCVALAGGITWIIVNLDLTDPDAIEHYQWAVKANDAGNADSAILHLKNALLENSSHKDSRLLLATLYVDAGFADAAREQINHLRVFGTSPSELRVLELKLMGLDGEYDAIEKWLKDEPISALGPDLLALLGTAKFALGQEALAAELLHQGLELDPEHVAILLALAHVERGKKNNAQAVLYAEAALAKDAKNFAASKLLADIELETGNSSDAQKQFLLLVQLRPSSLVARVGLIRASLADNDNETAGAQARLLTESDENGFIGHYFLALVARLEGDHQRAKSALHSILSLNPNHTESRLLLVQAMLELGELEAAESELTEALRMQPNAHEFRLLLSEIHVRREQPKRAISVLLPARNHLDTDPAYHAALSKAYFKNQAFEPAKKHLELAVLLSPDDPRFRGQLAVANLATGDTEGFLSQMEAASEAAPGFIANEVTVVLTLLEAGHTEEALQRALVLREANPANPVPLVLLGGINEAQGQQAAAVQHYEEALSVDRSNSAASLNLARIAAGTGNFRRAKNLLQAANEQSPNNITVVSKLAAVELSLGNAGAAVQNLQVVRNANAADLDSRLKLAGLYAQFGRPDLSWQVAEEAFALSPEDPSALFEVGRSRLSVGKNESAVEAFTQLSEQFPERPDAHFFLGSAKMVIGDTDGALDAFDRVLKLNPNHLSARFERGLLLVRLGQYDEALSIGQRIEKEHPNQGTGLTLQGDANWGLGQFEDALANYRTAYQRQPSNGLVMRIFDVNKLLGRIVDGQSALREWLEANSNDLPVRMTLAVSYGAAGQVKEAQHEYEQILERQPDNALALNNLAWLLQETNRDKAIGLAREAHELNPQAAETADTYGWLLLLDGQHEAGIELLKDVVLNSPQHRLAKYHFAYGLAKVGREKEAISWLKNLLKTPDMFDDRDNAEELLRELGG